MTLRFHEKSDAEGYGRIQTVGYLFSPDAGRSWQRSDGTPARLPVTAESVDVIASSGVDYGSALQTGALAVATGGTPWLIHSEWSLVAWVPRRCTRPRVMGVARASS